MNQYLSNLWLQWQCRGASPAAQPLDDRNGWRLTLCRRAKLSAVLILLLFVTGLVGLIGLQAKQPIPDFALLLGGYLILVISAGLYLIFVYWYTVVLDPLGLTLYRFLAPTIHLDWEEIISFDFQEGDELLKLSASSGKKVSLYLSLNGLSAVRRCLGKLAAPSRMINSWLLVDGRLAQHVPSWRCHPLDLSQTNPFDPLRFSEEQDF